MDRMDQALTHIRTELGRVDGKAFGLLGLASAGLTAGLAVVGTGRLTGPAAATGWTAVVLLVAGVVALGDAVRPRLAGRYGFMEWADSEPGTLPDLVADDTHRDTELRGQARGARTKYRRIQLGMVFLASALLAAIVTAILV
ncbi:Pycsar system effector family protein [Micromonospora cathayae]|uniref:DUF5706 domain-containing protein n=1 Tax=Micromonospora cathayae TaxID=3028804 RepID=A0ABY7ZZJ6_9ACTN|nr:Pycsar system effector family protein [Micromonospora sp. HUAS 3]WDZ87174.1 DUF5706 domain-containing protein [Micromonospora sp. HUAS 3]